jgi:hypothetical protein
MIPDLGKTVYKAYLASLAKNDLKPRDVMSWDSLSDTQKSVWSGFAEAFVAIHSNPVEVTSASGCIPIVTDPNAPAISIGFPVPAENLKVKTIYGLFIHGTHELVGPELGLNPAVFPSNLPATPPETREFPIYAVGKDGVHFYIERHATGGHSFSHGPKELVLGLAQAYLDGEALNEATKVASP